MIKKKEKGGGEGSKGKEHPLMGDKVAVREISLWTHEISSAGVSALLKVSVTSAWDLAQICILASASVFGKLTWNVRSRSLLTSQVMSVARGYVMT